MNNDTALIVRDADRQGARTPTAPSRNPAAVYLASLAPTGRRSMLAKLRLVAAAIGRDVRDVDWTELRFEHVAALRSQLAETHAPATVNGCLYALRGVARAAWNLDLITAEGYQRIRDVKPVRSSRLSAGRALSSGEIVALLDVCARDATPAGARDAAILALLVGAGLRRSEAAALDIADYDAQDGSLKVRGKGNKERLTYLDGGAKTALDDWVRVRAALTSSETSTIAGALLNPIRKSGEIVPRRMSAQALYDALRKRGTEAKIKAFSAHDLRRTFVGDLLDAGADISAVSALVGHANVQTTSRYDRRGEASKRKAAGLIYVPYRSRFSW